MDNHVEEKQQIELGAVRAKMTCHSIETTRGGYPALSHKVNLGAIYGTEGENKDFTEATPAGACWMNITDGYPALDFFKPGEHYYVTFTRVPKK